MCLLWTSVCSLSLLSLFFLLLIFIYLQCLIDIWVFRKKQCRNFVRSEQQEVQKAALEIFKLYLERLQKVNLIKLKGWRWLFTITQYTITYWLTLRLCCRTWKILDAVISIEIILMVPLMHMSLSIFLNV